MAKFGLGFGCSWLPELVIQLITRHHHKERPYFALREFIQRLHKGFAQNKASQNPRAVRRKWYPGGQGRPSIPSIAKPHRKARGSAAAANTTAHHVCQGARSRLWENITYPEHLGPVIVIQRDRVVRYSGINSIPLNTHARTHTYNTVSWYTERDQP